MGSLEPTTSLLGQRAPSPPLSQVFQTRAASADYLRPRIPSPIGKCCCALGCLGGKCCCAHMSVHSPLNHHKGYTCPLELAKSFSWIALKNLKRNLRIYYAFFGGYGEAQNWKIVYLAALLDKYVHITVFSPKIDHNYINWI